MTDTDNDRSGWDRRPVPDPTVLTTEALEREIAQLEKSTGRDLTGVERLLLGRIDRLRELMADRDTLYSSKFKGARTRAVAEHHNITQLMAEKLRGVGQQFKLIERQRREQKLDTKLAVDAALNAAKEAVKEQTTASGNAINKSESSTSDQLKQMAENNKTALAGIETRLSDLISRTDRIEAARLTQTEGKTENRATTAQTIAVIVAAFSFVGLLVAAGTLIAYIATHR